MNSNDSNNGGSQQGSHPQEQYEFLVDTQSPPDATAFYLNGQGVLLPRQDDEPAVEHPNNTNPVDLEALGRAIGELEKLDDEELFKDCKDDEPAVDNSGMDPADMDALLWAINEPDPPSQEELPKDQESLDSLDDSLEAVYLGDSKAFAQAQDQQAACPDPVLKRKQPTPPAQEEAATYPPVAEVEPAARPAKKPRKDATLPAPTTQLQLPTPRAVSKVEQPAGPIKRLQKEAAVQDQGQPTAPPVPTLKRKQPRKRKQPTPPTPNEAAEGAVIAAQLQKRFQAQPRYLRTQPLNVPRTLPPTDEITNPLYMGDIINHGTQNLGGSHTPLMTHMNYPSHTAQAPQMPQATQTPQGIQMPQGSHMVQSMSTPHGPQMPQSIQMHQQPQMSQFIPTPHGPQMHQFMPTPHGPQMSQPIPTPQAGRSTNMVQMLGAMQTAQMMQSGMMQQHQAEQTPNMASVPQMDGQDFAFQTYPGVDASHW